MKLSVGNKWHHIWEKGWWFLTKYFLTLWKYRFIFTLRFLMREDSSSKLLSSFSIWTLAFFTTTLLDLTTLMYKKWSFSTKKIEIKDAQAYSGEAMAAQPPAPLDQWNLWFPGGVWAPIERKKLSPPPGQIPDYAPKKM